MSDSGPTSEGVIVREEESGSSQSLGFEAVINEEYFAPSANTAAERYLNSSHRRVLELAICWSLLIILFPVLCMIALGVRLTSPGPILFRQPRHGRDMAVFELVKFRSMHWKTDLDQTVRQATPGDPRTTRLGRVLRHTSLDELPQLINVIKGDMSLIGPRPHALQHDEYYRSVIPNYCARFQARLGLTGLAQVSGARGYTPRVEDMERRVNLDLHYLQNASLSLDCRILLKTVKEVIKSDAAC